jgi:hypothetical protein
MFENGTSWSPAPLGTDGVAGARTGAGGGAVVGGTAGLGALGAGAWAGAAAVLERRASTSFKTSSRVIRPPGPVPVTSERSIPLSESSRRTMGEVITPSDPSACASPAAAGAG